jgi:hypothetical protein
VKFRRTESHAGKFTNPTRTCIDVAVAVPVIGLVAAQRVPGFVDAALTVNVPSSVAVGVPVNLASIVPLKVSADHVPVSASTFCVTLADPAAR